MSAEFGDHVGRVALLTGAGGAIGQAIAKQLAAQGATLVLHDLDSEALMSISDALPHSGPKHRVVASNLLDLESTRRQVRQALEDLGSGADILVNCAGVAADRRPLEDLDDTHVQLQLGVNIVAAIALAQLVIHRMKDRRWGRLINISSTNGTVGFANASAYNAAKGGLLSLAKGWAKEFGPWQITSNAVAPGLIETPMTKSYGAETLQAKAATTALGRVGQPNEIAAAVSFLASNAAGYVTGQVISPNGGAVIT